MTALPGVVAIALAALLWGISGGLSGLLVDHGWSALVIAFCRGFIGWIALLGWWGMRVHGIRGIDLRHGLGALVAGLGVAGNLAFYAIGIARGNVAVAATLMYTAPIHVFLISRLLGIERFRPVHLLVLTLVGIGIVLLTGVLRAAPGELSALGIAASLAAGLSYAVFIFGFRDAGRSANPRLTLVIAFAVFCAVLLPVVDLGAVVAALTSQDRLIFLALGLTGAGLSFPLYVHGLRDAAPGTAAVVAMIEPVTAALFGVLYLGDTLAGLQIAGGALIVSTVTIFSVLRARGRC